MGILKALRRKRAAQQTSDELRDGGIIGPSLLPSPVPSPMNATMSLDEIDKENEKPPPPAASMTRRTSSSSTLSSMDKISSPKGKIVKATPFSENELVDERDDSCIQVSLPESKSFDYSDQEDSNESTRNDGDKKRCAVQGIESLMTTTNIIERESYQENLPEANHVRERIVIVEDCETPTTSNDEFEDCSSIEHARGSEDDEDGSLEVSSSLGEITAVSDDHMLRDDEGNPIDLDEAEENMLRDDEGNIIDPKTLVVRDFLLDLSCESDEYYDDSGEKINPKELISCIDEHAPLAAEAVTDSSTQSEGDEEGEDSDLRVLPLHEGTNTPLVLTTEEELSKHSPPRAVAKTYEDLESKGRRNNSSSRRHKRRGHRRSSSLNNEYVHIMFQNRLSTLDEESWGSNSSRCSSPRNTGHDVDSESSRAHNGRNRERSPGSFDEKFIKARWEYSLQMMSCGMTLGDNGAPIDVSTSSYHTLASTYGN